MITYRIHNWQKHFETAKSRSIDALSWVAIPNKQDGHSYRLLLSKKGGPEALLAFISTVQRCSRQSKAVRSGWLTDDGTETGDPWTANDLQLMTDIPKKYFETMFNLCTEKRIEWIEEHGETPEGYHEDTAGTEGMHIREGKEDKEGKEGNTPRSIPTGHLPDTEELDETLLTLAIPVTGGGVYLALDSEIEEWMVSYPIVNIAQEIRKMRQWVLSNPQKKKTPAGVKRFITGWLGRAQDQGANGHKDHQGGAGNGAGNILFDTVAGTGLPGGDDFAE